MPVSSESDPAWCCRPILFSSSWSATSCSPPCRHTTVRCLSKLILIWCDRCLLFKSEAINSFKSSRSTNSDAATQLSRLYLQVLAAFHQVLDVIDRWEKQVEDLKEVVLLLGKPCIRQELHQVAKVIPTEEQRTRGQLGYTDEVQRIRYSVLCRNETVL